jgi:hypothetical protein
MGAASGLNFRALRQLEPFILSYLWHHHRIPAIPLNGSPMLDGYFHPF